MDTDEVLRSNMGMLNQALIMERPHDHTTTRLSSNTAVQARKETAWLAWPAVVEVAMVGERERERGRRRGRLGFTSAS